MDADDMMLAEVDDVIREDSNGSSVTDYIDGGGRAKW